MQNLRSLITLFILIILLLVFPLFLSRFYIYLIALIMVTGLLATSLNLVLGYGGIYQFHHAVFYGIGAYTFALILTKTHLSPWLGFIAAPLISGILGLAMGIICVRLSKLYFGMLQISLGSLVWAIVFRWYSFTGGDDGIHGCIVPGIIGSINSSYYFILFVVGICLFFMYRIVQSPFGVIFQSIRDNPVRSQAVGINVKAHQLIGLVIAGCFAGVAGSLFVVVEGCVFPDLLFWNLSLEILIMCLLGGWFTFLGPMLGAALIITLRTVAGIYTEYWTLILGIIMIFLIFFLPEGVLGFIKSKLESRRLPVVSEVD